MRKRTTLTELGRDPRAVLRLCDESEEPVFVADESGDVLVIMSRAIFERREAMLELLSTMDPSDYDLRAADCGVGVRDRKRRP